MAPKDIAEYSPSPSMERGPGGEVVTIPRQRRYENTLAISLRSLRAASAAVRSRLASRGR